MRHIEHMGQWELGLWDVCLGLSISLSYCPIHASVSRPCPVRVPSVINSAKQASIEDFKLLLALLLAERLMVLHRPQVDQADLTIGQQ